MIKVHSKNMDQNKQGEATKGIGPHPTHGKNQEESNPMKAPIIPPKKKSLQEEINDFWETQRKEAKEITDFRTHSLPLTRIKKIMKADEDVRMISAETPVVFAKACEMFIKDLTMRGWANAEVRKGKILQKSDVVSVISKTASFDFLDDIVPRDAVIQTTGTARTQNVGLNMPPHQNVAGTTYDDAPTMVMGRPFPDLNQ